MLKIIIRIDANFSNNNFFKIQVFEHISKANCEP